MTSTRNCKTLSIHSTSKPRGLKINRQDSPPCIMQALPNWVVWRIWHRDGAKIKVPVDPRLQQPAKTNDPTTWRSYEEAKDTFSKYGNRYAGVGFILGDGNGLFGIDLDGCVHDNELAPWACTILDRFDTYTELSPSGTGIKLYGIGEVPEGIRLKCKIEAPNLTGKTPGLEVYGRNRFFCFTGLRIGLYTQLHNCGHNLDKLLTKIQPEEEKGFAPTKKNKRELSANTVANARKWLTAHGPAISGQFGHTHTYTAALGLVDGFGLDTNTALQLLTEWNTNCKPPWSQRELVRKIDQARKR